ncbi:hypothetical protein V8G54_016268 [Vigna mungo]|uniref:Uncharacterized protein n=1 Tax=Vigna mungo TaxID=3915 RepID=A0AAQ3NNP0_VIGMU
MAPDPGRIRYLVGSEIQPFHEHHNGVSVKDRLVRYPVPRLSRLVDKKTQIPATDLTAPPQFYGLGGGGGVVRLGKWAPNDGSRFIIAVRGEERSNLKLKGWSGKGSVGVERIVDAVELVELVLLRGSEDEEMVVGEYDTVLEDVGWSSGMKGIENRVACRRVKER